MMNNHPQLYESLERELDIHGAVFTKTHGKSMKPLLCENRDAVLLKRPDREIRKYDVVLYNDSAGRHVLHRVIGEKGDVFIIRGDNTYRRELVSKEAIVAYMDSFVRNGKHRTHNSFGYRLYSRAWNFAYPLRFISYKFLVAIKKIFKRK